MNVDAHISEAFRWTADLVIDRALPIPLLTRYNSPWFLLDQRVEEDAVVKDGDIQIVTNTVTRALKNDRNDITVGSLSGNYPDLRSAVINLATTVKSNGANLNGIVLVVPMDYDENDDLHPAGAPVRLKVTDCEVEIEAGELAISWPDGTFTRPPE